jgi:hypothetical protein
MTSELAHFDAKSNVCGSETVIRGTCVTLRTLLASLADGDRTPKSWPFFRRYRKGIFRL